MIGHLLFDIDNTLYSASNLMERRISERMFQFIADFLSVPLDEAIKLQRARRHNYGTTLEWLECEHHLNDRDTYFEAVHPDSEISELQPDPNLRNFLLSLQMPMTVLTNAPMAHAERVLNFFNNRLRLCIKQSKKHSFWMIAPLMFRVLFKSEDRAY